MSASSSTWGTWYKIIDTNNISGSAVTSASAGYGMAVSGSTGAVTFSVSTSSLYVYRATVADSATGSAGSSAQVQTTAQTANASYFPTFVSANNASATAMSVYTTSSFTINPSTGNVGIGTSSPAYQLDVAGSARVTGSMYLTGGTTNGVAYLNGSNALTTGSALTFDGASLTIGNSGTVLGAASLTLGSHLSVANAGRYYLWAASNAYSWSMNAPGDAIAWYNNSGSEQMRLTSTGLGIGTSSPSAKLNVSGSAGGGYTGLFTQTASSLSNGVYTLTVDSSSHSSNLSVAGAFNVLVNSGTGLVVNGLGNVGIGTSSPVGKLTVKGGNAGQLVLDNGGQQYVQQLFQANATANTGGDFLLDTTGNTFNFRSLAANMPFVWQLSATAGAPFEQMRLTSTGLGIGTSSPAYKLDVAGSARVTGSMYLTGGTTNGVAYLNGSNVLTTGSALTFDGTGFGVVTSAPTVTIFETASGNNNRLILSQVAGISTYTSTYSNGSTNGHAFVIGNSEQMRLTSTGLGIGTSSPSNKLSIVGGAMNITNTFGYAATYLNSSGNGMYVTYADQSSSSGVGTNAGSLIFYNNTNTTERARIDSSGNLGIGTSSPAYKLDVVGSVRNSGYLINVNGSTIYTLFANDGGNSYINAAGAGNVGIGTSSPSGKLDVVATNAGGTTYNYFQNNGTSGTSLVGLAFAQSGTIKSSITAAVYGNDYMAFNVGSNTERARIDSSGNLGLGVTPSAWSYRAVEVGFAGTAMFSSAGSQNIITAGAYYNAGYKYALSSSAVSYYQQYQGAHTWWNAPSGTAGSAISFTQAMTLDNSGNLFVGNSVRSPIFYDSNNTGYFVTPSGNSVVVGITNSWIGSAISGAAHILGNWNGAGYWGLGSNSTHTLRFDQVANYTGATQAFQSATDVQLQLGTYYVPVWGRNLNAGTLYGSTYYDANNTGYYVTPSGTSYLNIIGTAGRVYADRFHTNGSGDTGISDSFFCGNWFRSNGTSGWYNQTYSGGIYMSEATYIRTYGNKAFYVQGSQLYVDGTYYDMANTGYYVKPSGTTNLNSLNVNGATNIVGAVTITGTLSATSKSFFIDHPTKEGMKLRYGSLEGPENGVYVRGRLTDNNTIELPDYWTGLVHEDTITVNLTPIGQGQNLYVESIENNQVIIGSDGDINCFYTVFAERKDVDKLIVEE
jgi:hypothetical protein